MTVRAPRLRVRSGHVAWVAERASERDRAIIETVNRLRLVTGWQLERLHFADLAEGRSRTVTRSRTLARLVAWRVLVALPRRVGGSRRGSTVIVYALDTAGRQLLLDAAHRDGRRPRVRRPGVPGQRWVNHTVAVGEVYVNLVEAERAGQLRLRVFQAEPVWPDGLGGVLHPDAFVVTSDARVDRLWWLEVDLGTESLPTVRRKLATYLDFVRRGQLGPRGVVPRVLVVTTTEPRRTAVERELAKLPSPAADLIAVAADRQVAVRLGHPFVTNQASG